MIRQFLLRQFAVFLLTGGTAAVNFLTRILCNEVVPFSIAVVCSSVTGMVTAFMLDRVFVFRTSTQPVCCAFL